MIRYLLIGLVACNAFAQQGEVRSYGQNPQGWRYSELDQINTQNAARLAPEWIYQTGVAGRWQSVPLVFDQQMYVTGPSNNALALDALTGKKIWQYEKTPPKGVNGCCGQPNRGFAAEGDLLFKVNF